MLTVEERNIKVIRFRFENYNNKSVNSLSGKNKDVVTFPLSDFVKLEFVKEDRPKYLVEFIKTGSIGIETDSREILEVDWITFDMLTKVFAAGNQDDFHIHEQPIIEFEPVDSNHNTVTILGGNIESVSHETFGKKDELFKVITTTKSYSVSKEDYDFFKKLVINR